MPKILLLSVLTGLLLVGGGFLFLLKRAPVSPLSGNNEAGKMNSSVAEDPWKEKLSPAEYHILREKGTDAPFESPFWNEHRSGTYYTVDTNEAVFRSEDKFDSGTGWPSFTKPIRLDVIQTLEDRSLLVSRTEVLSSAGGHLGHVFTDGPAPTGLRYCMNGTALRFVPDEEQKK